MPPPANSAESLYFEAAQPLLQQAEIRRSHRHPRARPRNTSGTALNWNWRSASPTMACAASTKPPEPFCAPSRSLRTSISLTSFLGKFLDQIPGRLPEVTKNSSQYEAANPRIAVGYLLHAKALNAQSIEPETARKLLEKAIAIDEPRCRRAFRTGCSSRPHAALRGCGTRVGTGGRTRPRRSGNALPPLPCLRSPGQSRRRAQTSANCTPNWSQLKKRASAIKRGGTAR